MKHPLALLALCYSTLLFSQSDRPVSFSINYGGGVTERLEQTNGWNYAERPLRSHQVSFQSRLENGRRIKPFVGLTWSVYRLKQDFTELTFGDMIDPRKGFIYETSSEPIRRVDIRRQYQYLRLPIGANFTLGNSEGHHFECQVSLSPDALLRSHRTLEIEYEDNQTSEDKTANYDSDLSSFGMTGQLDLTYVNPTARSKAFLMGVSVQGTPISVYPDSLGDMHWLYAGVNLGVRF